MWLVVPLVLAAQSGVVIGVGMRGSVLELSPIGKANTALGGNPTEQFSLSEVMAPHAQQRGGNLAVQFMRDLALGEVVTLEVKPTPEGEDDEVTRAGRARVGPKQLDEELVRAGWAWVRPGARTNVALVKLEAEARAAKRGLWAFEDVVEPWAWREQLLMRDAETKVVHAGWDCPHVKATQCAKCGGGRYFALEEATKEGFTPHEACLSGETLRWAKDTGGPTVRSPHGGGETPPRLPDSARRACTKDSECALTPTVPCTCPGCGSTWRQAARRDVAARMKSNFAKATCGPVGCPACAGREVGTKAVCVEQQCTPAP